VTNFDDSGLGLLRDAVATTPDGGTVDFQPVPGWHYRPDQRRILLADRLRHRRQDRFCSGPDRGTVFRLLRQSEARTRTVLITGHRAELAPSLESLCKEGADAVCYKPFDMPQLFNLLERLSRNAV
jgi:hypothetical protein